MQGVFNAEVFVGMVAALVVVVLPAGAYLKTILSVPKEKESIRRQEYEKDLALRGEQVEELKVRCVKLENAHSEQTHDTAERIDRLLAGINDLQIGRAHV